MQEVEVIRNVLYISDSPFFLYASSIITSYVQEDMNISWLTKLQVKSENPILEKLKKDPEQTNKIKKLEQELFDQKMLVGTLKRQIDEMK